MKKAKRSTFYMTLILILLLSGCSGDKDKNDENLSISVSPKVSTKSESDITIDSEAQDNPESTLLQVQNNNSSNSIGNSGNADKPTPPERATPTPALETSTTTLPSKPPEATDKTGNSSSEWDVASYTGFLSEQIYGKNIMKISTYSKWLGKDDPKNIWPIATDDTSEWGATVAAYDGSKNLLGYIDVPASAGGMVDYSAYVSKGIKYIRVTQASGSDSGYISITVYDAEKDTDSKT
ncbi:MAG: hypothetical protein GXY01_10305 [Clostridiales bacterium]|jgi:hypothetical protein|nr:hypothetical protein [Clostridiales bacterium]